jgi:hypothetical protein
MRLAAALVCLGSSLVVPQVAGAAPTESWQCIAGICVGYSRATIDSRYGRAASDIPSRMIRVARGRVSACFWLCANAVTEDGFTYYGGTVRPENRLVTVGTCNPIFRLPDGTTKGTRTPLAGHWRGYRVTWLEGGQHGWRKLVGTADGGQGSYSASAMAVSSASG